MKIFKILGFISRIVFPLSFEKKVGKQLNRIYTWRLAKSFKKLEGDSSLIRRKITLWHPENISIGKNIHIFSNCILATHPCDIVASNPELIIGDNCEIGENTHITCANRIVIGNGLLTGRRCTITDNSHGESLIENLGVRPRMRKSFSKGPVHIGDNVWLGDNVVVLPGVSIGNGCIIGANAVVTKDIPAYSVAVGNPAKVVKSLCK